MTTTRTTTTRTRRSRGSGHELRALIVERTAELLARLGSVEALTMRQVADAARVTTPSVYRHFPDKQALVREVLAERFAAFANRLGEAATDAAERGGGPVEQLEAMAHAYVAAGLADPGTYRVLFTATGAGPSALGGQPGDEHPGAASLQALLDAVARSLAGDDAPADPARVLLHATGLWTSLHGLVDLRTGKPELPWPDPAELVELAVLPVRDAIGSGR